ncbi:g12217 [Coccomyxa viridis]|uniref:protein-serine/threonine phosphatase n=1 Tax=Coccomyxa viridis TaxID=1274662 RepID=A0ABP1GAX6_9CHLO
MGCTQSSLDGKASSTLLKPKLSLPLEMVEFLPQTGPLSRADYHKRLYSTDGAQEVIFQGVGLSLRYAFVSQRGYYPEALQKANQDAVCAYRRFAGDPEQMFFGVFDGHGQHGTSCAQFAKDKVPSNLLASPHFATNPVEAFRSAMTLCNNQLHLSSIDDSLSGTTAITCLIRGRMLHVANVGDSRAILAERIDGVLVARPLSRDHTPFREDECERVRKFGARIMTLDQIEGLKDPTVQCWTTEEEDDGDPPRLWAPDAMYPGTAFTRSLGDAAAETIGVTADPEVASGRISRDTPFIVIASDGVFEFMQNQTVVNMVDKYEDPQQAAIAVITVIRRSSRAKK